MSKEIKKRMLPSNYSYDPTKLYQQTLSFDEAALYVGVSIPRFMKAIHNKEIAEIEKNMFRKGDLAAWTEEQRYTKNKDTASPFLTMLLCEGASSSGYIVPDETCDRLFNYIEEHIAEGRTGCQYIEYNGERTVEVIDPFFNCPVIDKFVWSEPIQKILQSIVGKTPYIVNNLRVLNKLPGRRNTLIHTDYTWARSTSRKDIMFSFQVSLTDPTTSDGGVAYLPKSHRIQENGRVREMPVGDYSGFMTIQKQRGDLVVLNSGVIHGSLVNTTNERRTSLFIEFISVEEALQSVDRKVGFRDYNKRYIFP